MRFESWQFYHAAQKIMGRERLSKLYTRSARLVTYWAADPRFVDVRHRNPLDRIKDMIVEMDLRGAGDIARAAIDFLAEPLGGRFTDTEPERSDKGTVEAEVTDVTVALGHFAGTLRDALADATLDAAERIRLKELARAVQREVDQVLDAAGVNR
jgi:hypothetical protein